MLIKQSPQSFKGGGIWKVVTGINGSLKAIGYALLVLFFLVGVVKTCGSFAEIKRPEHALKLFVRFAIAKGVITYGLDLMTAETTLMICFSFHLTNQSRYSGRAIRCIMFHLL